MKILANWLDERTGYKKLLREALFENVPGGARWRYVWGSTLTFAIVVQFITGLFLWMGYSPSSQTAWESVYYMQHELTGGWILRGIHHWTAQIMPILLVLHLMQTVIDGAYKAPREVNFWFGIALLGLILALSLTGYLLPWDQKGYWATKVATNIVSITPVVGESMQRVMVGGSDYGHHTLTRFFALHAGVLPGLMVLLIVGHIYLFRRHGITPKEPLKRKDSPFWPEQVLKDAVACMAVLATVMFLVIWKHGAHLAAPADPAELFSAARPDWYFMFLFQFLKYFPAESMIWGAIYIPAAFGILVFLMPFLGAWKLGHRFNLGVLFSFLAFFIFLTVIAYVKDNDSEHYRHAVEQAEKDAHRILELAQSPAGIPATGAVTLLRTDPKTMGPKLFAKKCAGCHRYDGHDGMGGTPEDEQSAPDLKGFASREWLTEFFKPDQIGTAKFFGNTAHKTEEGAKRKHKGMINWITRNVPDFSDEERDQLRTVIYALSAEAQLKSQREVDMRDEALIAEGREHFVDAMECVDCHAFREEEDQGRGPELTGYGSREWLIGIISDPEHEKYYPGDKNDRMPRFGVEEILTDSEIGILADWLRGEWYEPGEE